MPEEIPGKMFSAEETQLLRRRYIEEKILPALGLLFEKYRGLQSAALFVAQFWDDEASDAVHPWWLFSIHAVPDFVAAFAEENLNADPVNLPYYPHHWDLYFNHADRSIPWDNNGLSIPLFAAFCREDCHQDMTEDEAYSLSQFSKKRRPDLKSSIAGR